MRIVILVAQLRKACRLLRLPTTTYLAAFVLVLIAVPSLVLAEEQARQHEGQHSSLYQMFAAMAIDSLDTD